MEKRTKGKLLRVWFVCGLCLCALLAAKWLVFGDAAPRLRLVEEQDCVSGGKPVVVPHGQPHGELGQPRRGISCGVLE